MSLSLKIYPSTPASYWGATIVEPHVGEQIDNRLLGVGFSLLRVEYDPAFLAAVGEDEKNLRLWEGKIESYGYTGTALVLRSDGGIFAVAMGTTIPALGEEVRNYYALQVETVLGHVPPEARTLPDGPFKESVMKVWVPLAGFLPAKVRGEQRLPIYED